MKRFLQLFQRITATLAAFFSLNVAATECVPVDQTVSIWFPFSDTSLDVVGSLQGSRPSDSQFVLGKVGRAIQLDGTSGILLPGTAGINRERLTLETWVRRSSLTAASKSFPADGSIFGGETGAYSLSLASNGRLFLSHVGIISFNFEVSITDLEWHHVALTKDGSSFSLYLDGVSGGSVFVPFTNNIGPFAIGSLGQPFGGQYFGFLGSIDEFSVYSGILTSSRIAEIFQAGSLGKCSTFPPPTTRCEVPPDLVAWYALESDARDNQDQTPPQPNPAVEFGPGVVGNAAFFNGASPGLAIPTGKNIDSQEFSIEGWVRRSSLNGASLSSPPDGGIFTGDVGSIGFAVRGSDGALFLGQIGIQSFYSSTRVTDLNWHHVAVTRSGTTVRFYIDGRAGDQISIPPISFNLSTPFAIGALPNPFDGQSFAFLGGIDELALYRRALDPFEIAQIFDAGANGKCKGGLSLSLNSISEYILNTPSSFVLKLTNNSTNSVSPAVTNTVPSGLQVTSTQVSSGTASLTEVSGGTQVVFLPGPIGAGSDASLTINFVGLTNGTYQVSATASSGSTNPPASASASFLVRPACIPAPTQLTAWWRGESNVVDTIAGRDALATNGLSYTPGRIGTALRLNGQAGSGVSLGRVAALQRSEFTIEGWIRRSSLNTATMWGSAGSILGADAGGWNFQLVNNGNLSFGRTDIAGVESGVRIDDLQWHHVALVRTPTEVRFYRDGQLGATLAFTESIPLDLPYYLGGLPGSGRNGFLGDLDEISFYDRTLSSSEIAMLASNGGAPKCVEDLLITSTAGGPVALDEDFTARFVITSIGGDSTAVTFTNAVPPGMQLQSVTSSQGTVQNLAGFLRGSLGNIPAGSNAVVTVVFRPLIEGIYPLTATAGRAESELTLANNRFESTLDVKALAVGLVQDVTVTEEGGKPATAELEVALNAISTKTVRVDYATVAGSAAADKDFLPLTGRLEFPPGTVSRHLSITVNGDGIYEADEAFQVVLTPVEGALLGKTNAVVTIVSADPRPVVSVVSVQANEGNNGPTPFTFRFQLDRPSDLESSLFFATTNDSARAPTDFVATSGTLTFAPGQTNQLVEVLVNGDTSIEPNELFFLNLSQGSGLTLPGSSTPPPSGTLLNDDGLISQVAQFSWETPATAVTAGAPFTASLRALDSQGTVVSNFNSVVSLQAFAGSGRPSGVVFTEVVTSPAGAVELQNVTSSPVDLSGWTVAFYDSSRWPAPRASLVLPADTVVPAGAVFLINAGVGAGAYPTFRLGQGVSWVDRGTGQNPRIGVVLVDPFGGIGDAFFAGSAQPEEIFIPVQVRTDDWSGPVLGPILSNSTGYRRIPNLARNSRSNADWEFSQTGTFNLGRQNAGFVIPFTDSVPLEVVPNTASSFSGGRWSGSLTIRGYGSTVRLVADDGNGHRGLSDPFPMTVVEDLAIKISAAPLLTAPNLSSPIVLTVTNQGVLTASNVTAVLTLASAYGTHTDDSQAPQVSQGTATRTTIFTSGIGQQTRVTANFGSLPGQSVATLTYNPFGQAAPLSASFPTNIVSTATLTAEPVEFNLLNNVASVTQEVSTPCAAVPDGLVAWWNADAGYYSLVNGLVGEPTGSTTLADAGRVGMAYQFNGTNSAVRVEDSPLLNFAPEESFTLEFWVRLPKDNRVNHTIAGKYQIVGSVMQGYCVVATNGILVLRTGDGNVEGQWIISDKDVRDGLWHHVAVGRGGNFSYFGSLDGRFATLSGQPVPTDLRTDAAFRLGEPATLQASNYLQGELDEVQVYRQAIGSSAILASYRAGAHGRCIADYTFVVVQPRGTDQSLSWTPDVAGVTGRPFRIGLELRHSGLASAPVDLRVIPFRSVKSLQLKGPNFTAEYDPTADATLVNGLSVPVNGLLNLELTLVSTNLDNPLFIQFLGTGSSERAISLSLQIPLQSDQDGDGIPDFVETEAGLNPANPADAASDHDGDGWTAAEEFEAGTAANNAASALRLRVVDGQVVVDALSTRVYQLQRRDTVGLTDWEVLQTVRPTSNGPIILGPLLGEDVSGFYRVIVRQTY